MSETGKAQSFATLVPGLKLGQSHKINTEGTGKERKTLLQHAVQTSYRHTALNSASPKQQLFLAVAKGLTVHASLYDNLICWNKYCISTLFVFRKKHDSCHNHNCISQAGCVPICVYQWVVSMDGYLRVGLVLASGVEKPFFFVGLLCVHDKTKTQPRVPSTFPFEH